MLLQPGSRKLPQAFKPRALGNSVVTRPRQWLHSRRQRRSNVRWIPNVNVSACFRSGSHFTEHANSARQPARKSSNPIWPEIATRCDNTCKYAALKDKCKAWCKYFQSLTSSWQPRLTFATLAALVHTMFKCWSPWSRTDARLRKRGGGLLDGLRLAAL